MNRRDFVAATGTVLAAGLLAGPMAGCATGKKKFAMVGTGIRGISFWGKTVQDNYGDKIEFVGLCDINPGRVEYAKTFMGVKCPTFTVFEEMVKNTKPDVVIVTTTDSTHHLYIIKAMEMGCDVITEKPMTTDEDKCAEILAAEKKTGKKVTVGFNYRYGSLMTGIKEEVISGKIGDITSVDFHWYLNVFHGADYFRRWHRLKEKGGTLLVHKSTHHFDLINWWIDSDPVEVTAYGALEYYGKNNSFRGEKCRGCEFKDSCKHYMDITQKEREYKLYVENEHHDGYLRDGCVWREDIDIYDKMSVQIKYANNVVANYSLTTYSPYEGWRIAFNGKQGRIDSWEGIPWQKNAAEADQSKLHEKEMSQKDEDGEIVGYDNIMVMKNFGEYENVQVPQRKGGHGGGDKKLHDRLFANPGAPDPLRHAAGTRDGAMSILVGIAARKSIEEARPVKISELTDIPLMAKRP